jgi:hypothetical protein
VKTRWLDRRIALPGPYLTLVLSEAEFIDAVKHIGESVHQQWQGNGHACTHIFRCPGKPMTVIVALSGWKGRDPIEVAGMLVHEAVHVWQRHAQDIGEEDPGDEQEAYAVQSIAQELLAEFARRQAT